jgi:thioredoxin 1
MKELTSFDGIISHKDNEGFTSLTGKSVVLDFYADWCGPCKVASPTVEKLSEEIVNVDFFKVNVEENPEMSILFAIRAIPTFVIVTPDGKISMRMGWEGEDNFKKFVESSI